MEGRIDITGQVMASVRINLSFQAILTAVKFTRRIKEIEDAHAGEPFGEFFEDITSYTVSTILTSVTALESYINEVFIDRNTHFPEYSQQLIDHIWTATERKEPLEKYSFALSLKGMGEFQTDAQYYQDAKDLISVRNALVHFKPEWSHEEGNHKKLMAKLRSRNLFSPYFENAILAFPNSLMGYKCARWSTTTAIRFTEKFSEISGIPYLHLKLRPRLVL